MDLRWFRCHLARLQGVSSLSGSPRAIRHQQPLIIRDAPGSLRVPPGQQKEQEHGAPDGVRCRPSRHWPMGPEKPLRPCLSTQNGLTRVFHGLPDIMHATKERLMQMPQTLSSSTPLRKHESEAQLGDVA